MIRRWHQRSGSNADEADMEAQKCERKASIKHLKRSKAMGWFAMAVTFLFMITTFSPLASAQGIDLVNKDPFLKDVKIANVLKLDPSGILKKAANGEAVSFLVNNSQVSFKLVEGSFLSSNYSITYPDGRTLGRSDGIAVPRFFSSEDLVGASSVTATIAGKWMHFLINMNNRSYAVDTYDGTGASGYFAVFDSGPSTMDLSSVDVNESGVAIVPEPLDAYDASTRPNGTDEKNANGTTAMSTGNESSNQTFSTISMMSASYTNEHANPLVRAYLYYDIDYYNLHGSISSNIIQAELWDVHGQYESQAGVSFEIDRWAQVPGGVCTSSNAYTLWTQFMSYVSNNTNVGDWDVAHLFSGKSLSGGNYYARASGSGLSKFYSSSSYNGYGASVSQQTYSDGTNENRWLLGHCIGLSLNGDPAYANSQSWMCSTWSSSSSYTLTANNINRIQTFAQAICPYQKLINFGGSSIWTDTADNVNYVDLYCTNMVMSSNRITQAGETVMVGFTVYNTGNVAITYYRAFVAARSPSGVVLASNIVNWVVVPAHGSNTVWCTVTLNEGGEWTLWPGLHNIVYGVDHWSPSEWLMIHPTAYYTLNEWSGRYHSTDNLDLFYKWGVYSAARYPGPGNSVMADYTMFNAASGTGSTRYNVLFVETRDPNDACKDFGIVYGPVLTQKASGVVGGGHHGVAFTSVDVSGVWKMSPCYQTSGGSWGPWMAPLYVNVGIIILHYSTDNGSAAVDNGFFQLGSGTTCQQYLHPDNIMSLSIGLEVTSLFWSQQYNCPFMTFSIASIWNKGLLGYPYLGGNWAKEASIYVGKEQSWDAGLYATYAGLPRYLGSAASASGADIYYQVGGYETAIGNDFRYPTGNPQQEAITDAAIATTFTALSLIPVYGTAIAGIGLAITLLQAGSAFLDSGSFLHESSYGDTSAASVKWTGVDDRYQQEQTTYNEVNLRLGGGSQQIYCFSIWADFKPDMNQGPKSTPNVVVYLVP